VDQPVFVESRPVEAITRDDRPLFLTVRLTLGLADPAQPEPYVVAAIDESLKRWQEQNLPPVIAQVAADYTFEEALRNREKIAQGIEKALESWKAAATFGLILRNVAIVHATSPRVPRD
jgi:hypothetical protein